MEELEAFARFPAMSLVVYENVVLTEHRLYVSKMRLVL